MSLDTFDLVTDSITKNSKRPFHLLLGNGFSMSYDPAIFSYNALHDFVADNDDPEIKNLFSVVGTTNFELVMKQLESFRSLLEIFGADENLSAKAEAASEQLELSLIEALNALHPEHVFTMDEERSKNCAKFLTNFLHTNGSIFTTNYDLLLYWVLMRNEVKLSIDGFGRDRESPDEFVAEEDLEYSELRWGKHRDKATVHYLHGALPLFDTGVYVVKEQYDRAWILQNIEKRIRRGEYPIFVTAGDGSKKLANIRHNQYLTYCYDRLSAIQGSAVSFGFNFGDYDYHIIDALNAAASQPRSGRLWSLYVGVYSEADQDWMESIRSKFKMKLQLFDAKTVPVWTS